MRTCLLLLGLAIGSFALTPPDLHGMWKGTLEEDPTSVIEIYYGVDGKSEMRMKMNFLGITEVKMNGFGDWSVSGDTIYMRVTGGWSQVGSEPEEPIEAESAPSGDEATLVPGNPRKLQVEECDDGFCTAQEVSFVGSTKAFTLPTVGGGSSIWSSKGVPKSAKGLQVPLAMRVIRDGLVFDLIGRPAR